MNRVFLAVFLSTLALGASAFAQPEIDSTFGKLLLNNGHNGYAHDVLVQPDNKIVMVSNCPHFEDGNFPFCAARFNANGTYDSTFIGSGNRIPGIVRTRISGSLIDGETHGVALQSDGKLILVGYALQSQQVLSMVRYHPNGDIDTTFGNNGFVLTDVTADLNDSGVRVVVQPDGKIVVVGFSTDKSNYQQFVARYTTAGVLDDTFGTGGIFRASISGNVTDGRSIALQADGKILAGGTTVGTQTGYLLTRLNTDGSPDNTWDGDGYRIVAHTSGTIEQFDGPGIRSLAVQPSLE